MDAVTDDLRALIKRLRKAQIHSPVGKQYVGLFDEAADALERLEAIAAQRLRTLELYRALSMPDGTMWGKILDERDQLRCELAEALERVKELGRRDEDVEIVLPQRAVRVMQRQEDALLSLRRELAEAREALQAFAAVDVSPTFDAKASYSTRKSDELRNLREKHSTAIDAARAAGKEEG